jgi:hypothetical protein
MRQRGLVFTVAISMLLAAGAQSYSADGPANAQAINEGESPAVDNAIPIPPQPEKVQEDLGDIRPADNAPLSSYFSGQAMVNTMYTSNAPLYHSRDEADFLIAPSMEGSFAAPLNKNFRINLTARIEDFTYASHQNLGFWGFSGNEYLEYRYKPSAPRIYVGVEPYYYFSYSSGNRLTSSIAPVAGVDQTFSINRGKTLVYLGYHFGQYFSSPVIDTRESQTVTASLTQQIRRDLYAQLYWQFQYSRYNVYGRDETRNLVGVNLIHQFTPKTYVSLFVNYVDNASDNSLAKYEATNAGVSFVWQY